MKLSVTVHDVVTNQLIVIDNRHIGSLAVLIAVLLLFKVMTTFVVVGRKYERFIHQRSLRKWAMYLILSMYV